MHPSSTRLQAKQNHYIVVNICFNNDWIMFSELSTTNSLHKSYRVCLGSVVCFLHQIFTHTRGPPQNGTHRFIWKASVRDHYKGPAALIHHILHIYLNPLHCFFFFNSAMQYFVSACFGLCLWKTSIAHSRLATKNSHGKIHYQF